MMSLTLGNCCVHELMHASCDHYPGWIQQLKEDNLSTKDKTVTAEVVLLLSPMCPLLGGSTLLPNP